jgi:amino-acid N-acetyltransferase
MRDILIDRMRGDEIESVYALLQGASLTIDGLDGHLGTVLVARRGGDVVGSVALELYDDGALLRSLAVAKSARGGGVGAALTRAIVSMANDRGVRALYLLTETAEDFFPRFGFQPVARADVPAGVRGSVEFTTACPESAAVQVLLL